MAETGKTVDDLIDLGLDHTNMGLGGYASTMFTIGYKLSTNLEKACEDNGVRILTGTAADSLITDSGAVTGAKVHNDTAVLPGMQKWYRKRAQILKSMKRLRTVELTIPVRTVYELTTEKPLAQLFL